MANKLSNIKDLFKQGRTRVIILVTMFVLLIAIVVGVVSVRSKIKGTEASANISDAPGGIQSIPFDAPNEEYARLQQEQNEQQAKQAESVGGSAIPTIFKSSKNSADVNASMDGDAGLGFTGLSREQQAGVAFEPKPFESSDQVTSQHCPSDIIASSGSPVYDTNGRLIGYAGDDGKFRDTLGKVIGTVRADGSVSDLNGNKIGKIGDTSPMGVAIYDANGRLVGYAGTDGKVRDLSGKLIGVVGPDNVVRDANGKIIGQKKYHFQRVTCL